MTKEEMLAEILTKLEEMNAQLRSIVELSVSLIPSPTSATPQDADPGFQSGVTELSTDNDLCILFDTDGEGVDRLSCLPDSLLRDIISRLPIKDAARTEVLSRRWSLIWCAAPLLVNHTNLVVPLAVNVATPKHPPATRTYCSTLGRNTGDLVLASSAPHSAAFSSRTTATAAKLVRQENRAEPLLVVMYVPWCPFCHAMEAFYVDLAGSGIKVSKFHSDSEQKPFTQAELQLQSFPTELLTTSHTRCSMLCLYQTFANELHIFGETSASSEDMVLLCPAASTSDAYKVSKVMPAFLFLTPSSCYSAWAPFQYKRDDKFLKSPWPPPNQDECKGDVIDHWLVHWLSLECSNGAGLLVPQPLPLFALQFHICRVLLVLDRAMAWGQNLYQSQVWPASYALGSTVNLKFLAKCNQCKVICLLDISKGAGKILDTTTENISVSEVMKLWPPWPPPAWICSFGARVSEGIVRQIAQDVILELSAFFLDVSFTFDPSEMTRLQLNEVFCSWSRKMQLVSGFLLEVSPWYLSTSYLSIRPVAQQRVQCNGAWLEMGKTCIRSVHAISVYVQTAARFMTGLVWWCHSEWIGLLQSNSWREVQWNYCQLFVEGTITDEQSVKLMHSWKPPCMSYVHRNITAHYLASILIIMLLGTDTEANNWERYKSSYRWIVTDELFNFTDVQERNGFSYQDNCQVWHFLETKQYILLLSFDSYQYSLYFHLLAATRRLVLHFHQELLPFDIISFTVLWEISLWISPRRHTDAYAIDVNWPCDWVKFSIREQRECALFKQLHGTKQGILIPGQGHVLPFLKFLVLLQQKFSGVLWTNIVKDQRVILWDPGGSFHNLQDTVLTLDNFCVQATIQIKWCYILECAQLVFQIHVQVAISRINTEYRHGLPLTKDGAYHVSFNIREKHVPWDPNGLLQQRLGDKPCFKKGRMSGTLVEILRVELIKGRELDLGQEKIWSGLVSRPRSKATLHKRIIISMEKGVEGPEPELDGGLRLEASSARFYLFFFFPFPNMYPDHSSSF